VLSKSCIAARSSLSSQFSVPKFFNVRQRIQSQDNNWAPVMKVKDYPFLSNPPNNMERIIKKHYLQDLIDEKQNLEKQNLHLLGNKLN